MPRDCSPPPAAVTVAVAGGRVGRVTPGDDAGSFKVEVVGHDWISRLASVAWLSPAEAGAAARLHGAFEASGIRPHLAGRYDGAKVDRCAVGDNVLEAMDEGELRSWRRLHRLLRQVPAAHRHQVESVCLWGQQPWDVRALRAGLKTLAAALRRPRR